MDNKKRFIAVGVTGGPYTTWGVVDTTTDEWRISDDYYAPQARRIAQFLNHHPDASPLEIERAMVEARPSDRKFYNDPQYAERMADSPLMRVVVEQRKQREAEIGLAFVICVLILATLGAALKFVYVHWR